MSQRIGSGSNARGWRCETGFDDAGAARCKHWLAFTRLSPFRGIDTFDSAFKRSYRRHFRSRRLRLDYSIMGFPEILAGISRDRPWMLASRFTRVARRSRYGSSSRAFFPVEKYFCRGDLCAWIYLMAIWIIFQPMKCAELHVLRLSKMRQR